MVGKVLSRRGAAVLCWPWSKEQGKWQRRGGRPACLKKKREELRAPWKGRRGAARQGDFLRHEQGKEMSACGREEEEESGGLGG